MSDRSKERPAHNSRAVVYYDQRWRLYALQALGLAMLVLILIGGPAWTDVTMQKSIKFLGATLVLAAALGRLWSTLYIGGRKNTVLVTKGPYSITRNPLYFFSTLGSVGAGLVFESLILGSIAGCATGTILYMTSRGEARLLHSHFGARYRQYADRVPLFWPSPRLYEEQSDPTFSPKALKRTFGDALLLILVIPLAEVLDVLRHLDFLPQLIALY